MSSRLKPLSTAFPALILWLSWLAGVINFLAFIAPSKLDPDYDWSTDYGITEWLINYQAGFMRRGLPGEALHALWRGAGIEPIKLIIAGCFLIYAGFCCYCYFRARGQFANWLLASALLMGYPVYAGNIVRKDIFLVLLIAGMAHALPRIQKLWVRIIATNIALCFGMLVHEMFMFMALPLAAHLVIHRHGAGMLGSSDQNALDQRAGQIVPQQKIILLIVLIPSLALFLGLMLIAASGNAEGAMLIHNSWQGAWRSDSIPFPADPGGSIMWLSAQAKGAVRMVLDDQTRSYFFIPSSAWLFLAVFVSTLIAVGNMSRAFSLTLTKWFVVQLVFISPLFVIAIDSGRWVFLAFSSSFVLASETWNAGVMPFYFDLRPVSAMASVLLAGARRISSLLPVRSSSLLLIIGIPATSWTPMDAIISAPAYQLWLLARNLDIAPSIKWFVSG